MCRKANMNRIDIDKYSVIVAAICDPANVNATNRQLMAHIGSLNHSTVERYRRLYYSIHEKPPHARKASTTVIKIREGCWLLECGCTTPKAPKRAPTRSRGPNTEEKKDNTRPSKYAVASRRSAKKLA